MSSSSLYKRRWYDEKPELSRCIGLIEVFPPEIKDIIAQGMIALAEGEFQARELMSSLRSLGPEIILGIYKSKHRRRTHDQHELLHQALNYFYILNADNQIRLSLQVTQIVRNIYTYLDICRTHHRQPAMDDLVNIRNTYVHRGPAEAENLVSHLSARIADGVTLRQPLPRYEAPRYEPSLESEPKKAGMDGIETVSESDKGMQIKKND